MSRDFDPDWYDRFKQAREAAEGPVYPPAANGSEKTVESPAGQPVTNAILHAPEHVCTCQKPCGGRGPRLLGVVDAHPFALQHEDDAPCELSDAACAWFFAAMDYFRMRFGVQRTRCFYYVDDDKNAPCVAEVSGSIDHANANAAFVALYRWQPEDVANEEYLLRTACHEVMHLLFGDYCILSLLDRRDKSDKWNDVIREEHGIINVLMDCLAADDFWTAAPKFPLDEAAKKKIKFSQR